MTSSLRYETPENVDLEYRSAGLGTRFIAWFVDNLLMYACMFALFLLLMFLASVFQGIIRDALQSFGNWVDDTRREDADSAVYYFVAICILVWGFGSFLYFALSELLLHGQTIGKRICKIRVVKSEGFALDTPSVLLRNIFRVIDHLPLLWLVPLFSAEGRRLGDMASGTIVVSDAPEQLGAVRQTLAARPAGDARHRFDHAKLGKLAAKDYETIEQVLERWAVLTPAQVFTIGQKLVDSLARKMAIDAPLPQDRKEFLEDLLAAEYRRQDRRLY
ncbi:MAG: hypothetical protein C0483_17370 [Pirellula sp.]|nr:hypothetical protein [Pirellula sp.]